MDSLIPSADPARELFTAQLVEEAPPGGARREGLRLGNRITFGVPVCHDLIALYRRAGQKPPFDLDGDLGRYEFRLVRLVCTLHSAEHSAVRWAEVHVELGEGSGAAGGEIELADPADPPIAHDLYPVAVNDEVEVERRLKISPAIEFEPVAVELGEASLALRYRRLVPRITAFGRREPRVYWRFMPGAGRAVAPGIKEMDMIVRKRRGSTVNCTVRIEGRGQSWGIFPAPVTLDDQRFRC